MLDVGVSPQTVQRLPLYLNYLNALPRGTAHISATAIAEGLGLHDVQVRKDLAAVSSGGRPKTGYATRGLAKDLKKALSCGRAMPFAIVGMGNLGRALAQYGGFAEYNLHLAALFDQDDTLVGRRLQGLTIRPASQVEELCRQENIGVGIITVPPQEAQTVCLQLVEGGVPAIWNFAPVHLTAPAEVLVKNENMAASLGILSRHLAGSRA